ARFQPDHALLREPIVLFVGRLLEVKGVSYLLAAMQRVQARVPAARLVIIGNGDLREALDREASERHVRVEFLDYVSPDEIRRWMNRARVLCVPSVPAANGTIEALPMVALEAQAMELPLAGFASGGIPEAVVDGRTALLVAERDADALAEAIEALL